MKTVQQKAYLLILIAITIYGCDIHVFFSESVPPEVPTLSEIPMEYRGQYSGDHANDKFYIEAKLIYHKSSSYVKRSVENLIADQECRIEVGEISVVDSDCYPLAIGNGDSIGIHFYEIDTLFDFIRGDVAKMHEGRLFLNYPNQFGEFITLVLEPDSASTLMCYFLEIPDEEEEIKKLTSHYEILSNREKHKVFILTPTLQEFDRMLQPRYLDRRDSLIATLHKNQVSWMER